MNAKIVNGWRVTSEHLYLVSIMELDTAILLTSVNLSRAYLKRVWQISHSFVSIRYFCMTNGYNINIGVMEDILCTEMFLLVVNSHLCFWSTRWQLLSSQWISTCQNWPQQIAVQHQHEQFRMIKLNQMKYHVTCHFVSRAASICCQHK